MFFYMFFFITMLIIAPVFSVQSVQIIEIIVIKILISEQVVEMNYHYKNIKNEQIIFLLLIFWIILMN